MLLDLAQQQQQWQQKSFSMLILSMWIFTEQKYTAAFSPNKKGRERKQEEEKEREKNKLLAKYIEKYGTGR